jgi:hypothetical protein
LGQGYRAPGLVSRGRLAYQGSDLRVLLMRKLLTLVSLLALLVVAAAEGRPPG